ALTACVCSAFELHRLCFGSGTGIVVASALAVIAAVWLAERWRPGGRTALIGLWSAWALVVLGWYYAPAIAAAMPRSPALLIAIACGASLLLALGPACYAATASRSEAPQAIAIS